MQLKVLNAPLFTPETATKLEQYLANLPCVQHFTADPENGQFTIIFDETVLSLHCLAQLLEQVGCPIQSIQALTFR